MIDQHCTSQNFIEHSRPPKTTFHFGMRSQERDGLLVSFSRSTHKCSSWFVLIRFINFYLNNCISDRNHNIQHYGISNVDDCVILQNDLNYIYEWASGNNMLFNAQKFHYICFNPRTSLSCNVYTSSSLDIIDYSIHVLDLAIYVSSDCSFELYITNRNKRTNHLTGWILRTFSSRDKLTMWTLFKALVMSRLDYGSQLWSPLPLDQTH